MIADGGKVKPKKFEIHQFWVSHFQAEYPTRCSNLCFLISLNPNGLKYIRVALTVAVIVVGAFLVMAGTITANNMKEQAPQNRKMETAPCEGHDDTDTCTYAYCMKKGSECSFWGGECFANDGGYCDE